MKNYRTSEANDRKRVKISTEDIEESPKPLRSEAPGLLSLSDDVLLQIFANLSPLDLASLAESCDRLSCLVRDRTLWETVDFGDEITSASSLWRILKFLQPSTQKFISKGPSTPENGIKSPYTITKDFLRGVTLNAPNLKCLILDGHIIDTDQIELQDFPGSIQTLGLKRCILHNVASDKSYFLRIDMTLPKLKVLDLTESDWFIPHSLLALSKSHTLEQLILTGCDVSDCLPYASLAANFGFCSLQVLDLRFTCVTDVEVSCFNRTKTLRKLYLEAHPPDRDGNGNHLSVTDYSITMFGGGPKRGRENPHPFGDPDGVSIMEVGAYPRPDCKFETLVLRGYPRITDATLRHAAQHLEELKFLDVTNCGCTMTGIMEFKRHRPDVKFEYGHGPLDHVK